MPQGVAKKGGKKNRKLGRDEKKCQRYRMLRIREKNKIKRIAKSNGWQAARSYAEKHNLTDFVTRFQPKA